MKRINNLYSKIYDVDNLILADKKASRGKSKRLLDEIIDSVDGLPKFKLK